MLVLSVTGTRQQTHGLAAASPASSLSCQHAHSPCLLGCLSVAASAVTLPGTWCAGWRWTAGWIISLFKCKAPWKAGLQPGTQPSQHFSEKPFAELCYIHCFFPARTEHCLVIGFYASLWVFSILPFRHIQNYVYAYAVFDRQKSDLCIHRHTSVRTGYGLKCICSMRSWHLLFHPPALMALSPSVDVRCITVPLSLVMWPLDYMVLYFDLFLGRKSHINSFKRINTYKWEPWNHERERKRGKTKETCAGCSGYITFCSVIHLTHWES